MKRNIIAILFLLTGLTLWAQEPSLPHYSFKLDSTSLVLGDQVTLSIEKTSHYPTLEELTNNDIVAVKQWMDTASGTLYTALTSFEIGEHWLHIGDDSIMLVVSDVPNVDTTSAEIRDIAPILRQPYTFWEIFRWVLLALLVAAVVVAAIFVIKRMKEKKPLITIPKAPPLPPDARALQALEDLRQRQLWQQGMVKEYHTELTDILRNFLEEAYHIQSTEMTSDQTLDAFAACPAHTPERASMLQQILQTADMVKFAKSEPLPFQHDNSLNYAVEFVKALAPKPTPATTPTNTPPTPVEQPIKTDK